MKKFLLTAYVIFTFVISSSGQGSFGYTVNLEPVSIPGLPGLHSYAFGQHDGKWLIIGGRLDGMHARQPFNSFPQTQNSTDIYVVDVAMQQFWMASVNSLPVGIKEQLQSTNMNFYQHADTLYIIGGYAFSETANDHITFPNLTSIQVSAVIDAIVNGTTISPYFKQISDNNFAITGGQLGKIDNYFYLIGGQRFDGVYNPMGMPTFTQSYSNEVRKFSINNSGTQLSVGNYSAVNDPVHLRRRDYNLLPQIFPDRSKGYTISSGVFQLDADLPFLYPVDIKSSGYTPVTGFNQYLSNYHSAKACLYDSLNNEMHTLFFGGISQYYYQNGTMIQDDQVPFVKTISLLTRSADGTLHEFQLPDEMPALKGASAEFIPNNYLPHYHSEIIKLSEIEQDTILAGHIYGGILSPSLNPFTNNQTNTTIADPTIYAVRLVRNPNLSAPEMEGKNPYSIKVYPNPASGKLTIELNDRGFSEANYYLTNSSGQIIMKGKINSSHDRPSKSTIKIDKSLASQTLFLTVTVDHKYYLFEKIIIK